MLCTFENDEWVYRRNPKIRGPISKFGWTTSDGTLVIASEIQLLYKSRSPRVKDKKDFETCLGKFNREQLQWLVNALSVDSGESHPWISLLKENVGSKK